MSQTIEDIIATDKQAREIVQRARSRREEIMADAAKERDNLIKEGEAKLASIKSMLLADNESHRIALEESAAREFAEKKAALDKTYNENEQAWTVDIIKSICD